MRKIPVQFHLDLDQASYLRLEAMRTGVSMADLVRRFINENKSKTDMAALIRYFTDKESHSHAGNRQ